ncbi:hypothetical protein [Streptomyces tateyamensis]|uniref:hypothetical protein n=1 Tax=Streptomyces tateyamensis TaxID=565073 RepID=UPI0011B6F675|nr:hypothetical protein [Streptomyces tateyamensis]
MSVSLPLVGLLFAAIVLLNRVGWILTWQLVLLTLFGMCLDRTVLATPVFAVVEWLLQGLTHTY